MRLLPIILALWIQTFSPDLWILEFKMSDVAAIYFWNKPWNNGRKVLHQQVLMELGTFTPYYNQIYLIASHTWVLEAIFDGGIHIINSGFRNLPFTFHPCVCCIWLVIYLPFKSRWTKDCLNLFIVMFGGFHIEIAAFRTIGDWLQNNGWVSALSQANIASAGTTESVLKASHVTRTRHPQQVTACSLHILMQKAYRQYLDEADEAETVRFPEWKEIKDTKSPLFHFWSMTFKIELNILIFVRSLS